MTENDIANDEMNTPKPEIQHTDENGNLTNDPIEGILERVAKADPQAALSITEYIVQKVHQGPIPSAEEMEIYSRVQRDIPDRMMAMAELSQRNKAKHADKVLQLKEQEIALEKQLLAEKTSAHKLDYSNQRLSLIFAFITVLVCILGSFYLALQDKTEVAGIIGGATVVGIVLAFLKSKNSKNS